MPHTYFFLLLLPIICDITLAFNSSIATGPCKSMSSPEPRMFVCDFSASGGLCAFFDNAPWQWCCVPGEASCGNWGQTCTGSGNTKGPGQVQCSGVGESTKNWCCEEEYEQCDRTPKLDFWCIAKNVNNPYQKVSQADALISKSALLAGKTVISTTQSSSSPATKATTSTSSSSPPNSQIPSSRTGSESSPTATIPAATSSSPASAVASQLTQPIPPISGGAIGGIVVGGVAGMALIAAAIFFGLRKRPQRAEDHSHENAHAPTHYSAEPPVQELGGYYTPKELGDTQVKAQYKLERSELP